MKTHYWLAAIAAGGLVTTHQAHAHGFAGDHMFISTLLIDDPNVADEASLPTFIFQPQPNDGGPTPNLYQLGFEFDKRITENFGFAVNEGYNWITQPGSKTANGWQSLVVTLKDKPYVNDAHEFLMSVGVQRVIAGVGAQGENGAAIGNDPSSSTIPTFYFGKGFGDLPSALSYARPFAITGTIGEDLPTSAEPNNLEWGLALEYSLPYLQSQVKDVGLRAPFKDMIPLVEFSFTSPENRDGGETTGTINPGVLYESRYYQLGVEAIIPVNSATGHNVGAVIQLEIFIDDILPKIFGHPIIGHDN